MLVAISLAFHAIGCSSKTASSPAEENRKIDVVEKTPELSVSTNPARPERKEYLGCWTSYNANGLYLKADTIQTRNSYGPIHYEDVTDQTAREKGVYLLKIRDKDKSNELRNFMSFKLLPNNEMEGRGFESYSDFQLDNFSSIQSRWVKDGCDVVLPTLHGIKNKKTLNRGA